MKTLYFISSYDKETDSMIESIPVDSKIFEMASAFLPAKKRAIADSIEITSEIYKSLKSKFNFALPLGKVDYFVERCGDYTAEIRA